MFTLLKDKPLDAYSKSTISFVISFEWNTLSFEIVEDCFGMIRDFTNIDFRRHLSFGKYLKKSQEEIVNDGMTCFDIGDESLMFGNPFHFRCPPMHLRFNLTKIHTANILDSIFISKVLQYKNITSLYITNSRYLYLQQATRKAEFSQFKVPLYWPRMVRSNTSDDKIIDIEKNPGYPEVISNTWLMAAWQMWFKNDFFNPLIGKEMYDFPFAFRKSNEESVTFIQLYENQDEPHYKLSLKRQKQFKKWIDFDNLVKKDRSIDSPFYPPQAR